MSSMFLKQEHLLKADLDPHTTQVTVLLHLLHNNNNKNTDIIIYDNNYYNVVRISSILF